MTTIEAQLLLSELSAIRTRIELFVISKSTEALDKRIADALQRAIDGWQEAQLHVAEKISAAISSSEAEKQALGARNRFVADKAAEQLAHHATSHGWTLPEGVDVDYIDTPGIRKFVVTLA